MNEQSYSSARVKSIKYAFFGGDIVTKDFLLKAASTFPSAQVAAAHGMTEGGANFAWPFFDVDVEKLPFFGEVCPLGNVQRGSRLRIFDVENQRVAKRDQPGELHICSEGLIKHYLGGFNEDAFYEDELGRWFKTGDLAIMNKDNIVWILGRIKDRIKRAGVPITPAALESCIENFTNSQVCPEDTRAALCLIC